MLRHYYKDDPLASVIHGESHDAAAYSTQRRTPYKTTRIPFGTSRGDFTRNFSGRYQEAFHFTPRGQHPLVVENKAANKMFGGR